MGMGALKRQKRLCWLAATKAQGHAGVLLSSLLHGVPWVLFLSGKMEFLPTEGKREHESTMTFLLFSDPIHSGGIQRKMKINGVL
jgi:hypothetical protein